MKICLPELTPNLHGCAELGPPADLFGGEDRQDGRARGEERRRQELAAPAAARGEPDAGARPFVEPSAVAKRAERSATAFEEQGSELGLVHRILLRATGASFLRRDAKAVRILNPGRNKRKKSMPAKKCVRRKSIPQPEMAWCEFPR